MKWTGAYYSWTNKRVWSRIDRVFTNVLWYETMDYTQAHYLSNSLSNHTPMLVMFQFCDMWIKHEDFGQIIASVPPAIAAPSKMLQVKRYLDHLRPQLKKLNRHHYADLRAQQEKAKLELTNLQLFTGAPIALSRDHRHNRRLFPIEIPGGTHHCKLTKIECRGLVEKILAKVHLWATRSISFIGRAKLISSVIFGLFNYWASIFMLPNEVLDSITKICRNYLWRGGVLTQEGFLTSLGRTFAFQKYKGAGIEGF
ncbi:LOW QUALITY PROTEIN: hypothetical protein Cgig2_024014 [Carnegiea gigantea]|uniref:Uncharacterized protein n=1 Tax=Carnegiea gigantea TaxID=171969 RepID=A0A9Q1GH83_9CARY|nr:LOW QUALITY PROTEIN: hypothetical protein Cgig2_024014 [Carnegiea gigantea]